MDSNPEILDTVKIGTRGSKLALWQAHYVSDLLTKGGIKTEIVIIETKGDKILDVSISKIGSKGVFTEELEEQLRNGNIDIAVHSAKDLQSELPEDLEILAFTERETANDVLVSFKKLPDIAEGKSFVIGTSSTRRIAILKHYYPHISTVDMRGNLQTRLQKLQNGVCDALILAYAGVHRMGYDDQIVSHLSTEQFTPAVGQGSIAVQTCKNLNPTKKALIKQLTNHAVTEACLLEERSFLAELQGGCSIPVFGMATYNNGQISLNGGIVSLDGKEMIRKNSIGFKGESGTIGKLLAAKILSSGGQKVLDEIHDTIRK